jgi:hypothetical protein
LDGEPGKLRDDSQIVATCAVGPMHHVEFDVAPE